MSCHYLNQKPYPDYWKGGSVRPRDGTKTNPQEKNSWMLYNGSVNRSRDGTISKSRDGTFGSMPRDGTEKQSGLIANSSYILVTLNQSVVRNRGRTRFRKRRTMLKNRSFEPVMGEVCPPESENCTYEFRINMREINLSVRQKANGIIKPKEFNMSILIS
jgi:hypothetical protein